MIVYQATKEKFMDDVVVNNIEDVIHDAFYNRTGKIVGESEHNSWKKSLRYMRDVLRDDGIPWDAGVTIEYHIPQTSKRIDFILTGQNEEEKNYAILIELKQWSEAQLSEKDGIVRTDFYGEQSHPSYQVWSYAALLEGFNETVYEEGIKLQPCAYLHNYIIDDVIRNPFYAEYIAKAPVFLEGDLEKEKLQAFIKQFVKRGDKTDIMYRIDVGRIRPSKYLADRLASMIKGNKEFIMIDDQKVVYETALSLTKKSSAEKKNVLIVQGGPGTGKSVVAVSLLVELTRLGLLAQYVSKNAAPRAVYESKLTGTLRRTEIGNMFSSSGSFFDVEENIFDALLVDEAHRLNKKSGIFKNLGENQIKELIQAAKCTIFFLDEDQRVTWHDVGERGAIEQWARDANANVQTMELASQFRCNGSDGYLAWLDDLIQIKETANLTFEKEDYDFRVIDSPIELRDLIFEKNKESNKARLVAGYCWDWVSRKDSTLMDITFSNTDFAMQWNLTKYGSLWIVSPESVKEVGCIHTCQGLEIDYIGVIIGPDLVVRNGKVTTDPNNRAKTDTSLKGFKKELKENPEPAQKKADAIIKNTYRILMTRGMKGCYIYCTDEETSHYFNDRLMHVYRY